MGENCINGFIYSLGPFVFSQGQINIGTGKLRL